MNNIVQLKHLTTSFFCKSYFTEAGVYRCSLDVYTSFLSMTMLFFLYYSLRIEHHFKISTFLRHLYKVLK